VLYETEAVPVGMLALGVPCYRLPREVIERESAVIEALGVEILYGVRVETAARTSSARVPDGRSWIRTRWPPRRLRLAAVLRHTTVLG